MKKRAIIFSLEFIVEFIILTIFISLSLFYMYYNFPYFSMKYDLVAFSKLNYVKHMVLFPGVIPGTHFFINTSEIERNWNIYYYNNWGLAGVDKYGEAIPYSVDLEKFKLLKKGLEYCYNKYNLQDKHTLQDFNVSKGVLPAEEMICILLYNYNENFYRYGYFMKISCKNEEYTIKLGKKGNICVELPILLVKKNNREYCKLTFC